MPSTLIFYRFTRRMIERNELGPFMRVYNPASLETWKHLPDLFGRMVFSFDGFEDNWSFEPNLRRFWRVLNECWPYWVLFCDLGQRDLRFMTLGCLRSFQAITVPDQSNVAIFFDRDELNQFLDEQFRQTHERCSWFRGMKRILLLRRREVLAYFRQPLDSISFIPKSPQRPRPVPRKTDAPEWRIRRR